MARIGYKRAAPVYTLCYMRRNKHGSRLPLVLLPTFAWLHVDALAKPSGEAVQTSGRETS
eukprot:2112292-Amphidinium_carterae.1